VQSSGDGMSLMSNVMAPPPFPPDYRASGLLLHVTSTGNWTWRCSEKMLFTSDFHSLLELTKNSNRTTRRALRFAGERINEAA